MLSYIRKGKYSPARTPSTTPVYVTLRVPPLDSEMGWTGAPLPRRTWFAHSWITRNLKWPFFICYQGRLIGLFHLGF